MMSKADDLCRFIAEHKFRLIVYSAVLVCGLGFGILSALKPVDPLAALASHNGSIYAVTEQAAYLQFIFGSLFVFIAIVISTSFLSRLTFAPIILIVLTVVVGYFQGGTVVLVIRVYGALAIPFAVCYAISTLVYDLILFAHFAVLSRIAGEVKKYGCSTPLNKVLLGSVYVLLLGAAVLLIKYVLVILLSFFL